MTITKEKELELIEKSQCGDKIALEELIHSHNRFIQYLANKNTPSHLMHDKDAVEQEGRIGLMRAIEKYDTDSNMKLLTYATQWIVGRMQRYIQDNRNIHVPVHVFEDLNKLKEFKDRFIETNLREPTEEEISEALNLQVDEVTELIINTQNSYSIDFKYDNDTTLGSILEESSSAEFEHHVELSDCKSIIMNLLMDGSFTDTEIEVAIERYGLNGEELTLEDIGKRKSITKERVRQIEEKMLKKFRSPERSKALEDYSGKDSLLTKLRNANRKYISARGHYAFFNLPALLFWLDNFGKNETFDVVMLDAAREILPYRKEILEIVSQEKKNGSRKIRYFLDSLGIDIDRV